MQLKNYKLIFENKLKNDLVVSNSSNFTHVDVVPTVPSHKQHTNSTEIAHK